MATHGSRQHLKNKFIMIKMDGRLDILNPHGTSTDWTKTDGLQDTQNLMETQLGFMTKTGGRLANLKTNSK